MIRFERDKYCAEYEEYSGQTAEWEAKVRKQEEEAKVLKARILRSGKRERRWRGKEVGRVERQVEAFGEEDESRKGGSGESSPAIVMGGQACGQCHHHHSSGNATDPTTPKKLGMFKKSPRTRAWQYSQKRREKRKEKERRLSPVIHP